MAWLLLLWMTGSLPAAVGDLTVAGSTSTQVVLTYTAPSEAVCSLEASKASSYAPLAVDIDPVLYPASDLDSRAGNITNGRYRIFVLGKQGPSAIGMAADGYRRSRALQADTTYYLRVTCGADTATATARTANIGFGNTRGEALAIDQNNLWEYEGITANAAAYSDFPDPFTGVLVKRPAGQGLFGFGASSSTWPDGNTPGDCNKTLTGVKGSCQFAEAIGSGWTPSSGTLSSAVRGNDSNYAEYSGTSQQPLFIRLGVGRYPTSSSGTDLLGGMSFQNVILRALTTDATGDGGQIELCVTFDGVGCYGPWLRHTLSTTETTVRFCKDAPCSTPEAPGDLMADRFPPFYIMARNVKVHNQAGSLTTLKFSGSGAAAFCDSLSTEEYVVVADSALTVRWNPVSSKSCASSPPQITTTGSWDFTTNGTAGVGVYTIGSIQYNPRYGVLVRKVSTTSGSTIKIGYALWRMAVNTPMAFALGSGGFGKRCQNVPTAQGEYLCQFNKHIVGISYNSDGSLNMTNYGYVFVRGSYLNGNLTAQESYGCMGNAATNDSTWSDTEPGVFYCHMSSTYHNPDLGFADSRQVLVKLKLDTSVPMPNGDPDAAGTPGLGNKAQRLAFTAVSILTPCLGSCASVSDDYTPYAQRKRFNPAWTTAFNACSIESVQGSTLMEICKSGSQDSHAWVFSYDLGNGLAVGSGYTGNYGNTQQVFGGFLISENQACRWCGIHTFQAPLQIGGADYTVIESTSKCPLNTTATKSLSACSVSGNGTCSACPAVTLNGFDYTGKNWCSNLTLTTSWNSAWGSTPAVYETGDPVAPNGCVNGAPNLRYWGQKLQVGDFLIDESTYEIVRIIQKNSNTDFDVVRGWGSGTDSSFYSPKSHNSGITWFTRCGLVGLNPVTSRPELSESVAWWYKLDPGGTNPSYTYRDGYQNHAFHSENFAVKPEYQVGRFDNTSPSSLAAPGNTTLHLPSSFAGLANNSCTGNGCEKHPSYGQILGDSNARNWFADVHPRLGHGGQGFNAAALVSGKTYTYKWQGLQSVNPRHFDLEVYSGYFPFQRADTITDSPEDSGKWCWAVAADDCFPGSTANAVYVVFEEFDTRFINGSNLTCREAEFAGLQNDLCIGNTSGIGSTTGQWRIPLAGGEQWLNGSAFRAISKYARTYRDVATENVKVDPKGKVLFSRGNYYLIPPAVPGVSSRSRSTYTSIKIDIPSVPANTSTAVVEFGYNEGLQCSRNRNEVCIAESAALNETVPYRFAHETITGVPCASACSITVPALDSRVLYYRIKYRDASGNVLSAAPRQIVVVN